MCRVCNLKKKRKNFKGLVLKKKWPDLQIYGMPVRSSVLPNDVNMGLALARAPTRCQTARAHTLPKSTLAI